MGTNQPLRAVLFAGQGAQRIGMGADLAEKSSSALALYELADSLLGWPVTDYSFQGPDEALVQTRICQPALYVHGLALLAAFQDITGNPLRFEAAAGLSLGEYTAHAAAGTFTFQSGLHLVAERGRLMQEACDATVGSMVTLLGINAEQAAEIATLCNVDVANLNCPGQVVLAGGTSEIENVMEVAKARGARKVVPLKVAGAYHSRLMASAAAGLAPFLSAAHLEAPVVPVIANYIADVTNGADQILRALESQVCGTVRWEESIRRLIGMGVRQFVECGPGAVLKGLLKRIDPEVQCISVGSYEDLVANAGALG